MRKILLIQALFLGILFSNAQNNQKNAIGGFNNNRCGTMNAFEKMMKDPLQKERYEKNQRIMLQNYLASRSSKTMAIDDTIPCVIHIILPNAEIVTDATCQSQMDVLTRDFSGLNADSVNIPTAFKPLFGKTKLKFMLAKTDPNGFYTTGVERRNNNISFTVGNYNNAKTYATGGLDNWDPCQYLNFWVVQFSDGTLGVSVFPGTGTSAEQGFECDYRCFGTGASYLYSSFNLGRTSVHEIGHYFNLRHINGDATCGNDFPGSPAGWDDTPLQADLSSGCLSGVQTDACSSSPPGFMYQNYMDYTDDACYALFTIGQTKRIEQALTASPDRSCLLNSTKYQAPVIYANDAAITSILNPASGSLVCNGMFAPKFTLRNNGSAVLSTVNIVVTIDGVLQAPVSLSPNLAAGSTSNITLANVNLSLGSHTILISTNLPNNSIDQNTTNDVKTTTFTITSSIATPLNEGIESPTFPSSNWVLNPSFSANNWERTTAAYRTGVASMKANFYDIAEGETFSLTSLPININYNSSSSLSFDYAYNLYTVGGSSAYGDTLSVLISADCGNTWNSLWKKGGLALKTVSTAGISSAFTPNASQWSTSPPSISLNSYLGQTVQIKFMGISGYGNNLYVDNISVTGTSYVPLQLLSFTGFVTAAKNVQLNFATANEINCDKFIIEKSYDGNSFEILNTLPAKNEAKNTYTLVDIKPSVGNNYYRVKQVDKDGKVTLSNTININLAKAVINTVSVYPNPVKEKLSLNISSVTEARATIKITDALGKTVLVENANLLKGNQTVNINTNNLASGVYHVAVIWGGEVISQKIIKL